MKMQKYLSYKHIVNYIQFLIFFKSMSTLKYVFLFVLFWHILLNEKISCLHSEWFSALNYLYDIYCFMSRYKLFLAILVSNHINFRRAAERKTAEINFTKPIQIFIALA